MKTTVDIPDELLREAQRLARDEGTTLRSVVEEGLRQVLARHREAATYHLPDLSVDGNGLRPELRGASWDRLRELSYGERL